MAKLLSACLSSNLRRNISTGSNWFTVRLQAYSSFTPLQTIIKTATRSCASQQRQFSEMGSPVLYFSDVSPPSRAVLLTAAAVGIDLDIRETDLRAGDHLTKEFLKMNPEHTVPTLNDDGFILWDSHAINCYLVDKYAKNDTLYPKDLKRRALVNQRLYFENGVLFARLRFSCLPLFRGLSNTISEEKLGLVEEAFHHLNSFLDGKEWLVGDSYTLADISCVTSVSSLLCIQSVDKYPHVQAWLKRCEDNLPGYATANLPGCKKFHYTMKKVLSTSSNL